MGKARAASSPSPPILGRDVGCPQTPPRGVPALSCPSCGTPVPVGARFCPSCGHGIAASRGDERRLVTVLFADLVGYTTLAEARDPEQVKNLVDGCFERLAVDVVGHGGRVDKIVGDAIMALFGAPVAHEDDAERAVRAGLQMQRTLASWTTEHGVDIRMRVGVNSGEVLVGALRAGGDYTAMGDVVNTASRLQTAARPGQVLVGPATYAATRDVLDYDSLGLVRTRGREEPVPAWSALGAVAPPGHRPRKVRTALIGREAELGMLRHALTLAEGRRRAQLVVLIGEAGTGKTRLAEEIAAVARLERGAYCLEGRCVPYGESNVWWPMADALRRSCGINPGDDHAVAKAKGLESVSTLLGLPRDDRELERVLRGLIYLIDQGELTDVEPARARDEAVRSMAVCLERMTATQPLVFIVSELHWADDLLLEFLDRLLDRVQHLPILLVATARPELADRWRPPPGRHNQLLLHVDPLDAQATARLLDELVVSLPSPEVRDALVERSGGNPLFLEELVALTAGDRALEELPLTLRGLVAARLDGLGVSERAALEDAAVVGRTGLLQALEAMASSDRRSQVVNALNALVASDILALVDAGQGCQGWEFRAEVVREVAYGTLTKAERARRHAVLAEWLAGQLTERVGTRPSSEELDAVAHHYGTAVALTIEVDGVEAVPADAGAKALWWLEQAATRAAAEGLWQATSGLLDQALSLAQFGTTEDRDRLVVARAKARIELLDGDGARSDVAEVRARAAATGDRRLLWRALVLEGQLARVDGRLVDSVEAFRDAVTLARDIGEDASIADALRHLGQALLFVGDEVGADSVSMEALTRYRALGDRRGEAWALQHLAWTAFYRGDFGPAEDHLRASADTFSDLGDWSGHSWAVGLLAWVRFSQGHVDEARELAEHILAEGVQAGDRWAVGMMTMLLANVSLWTGRTQEAVARASEARAVFVGVHDTYAEVQSLAPLTRGLLALGRVAEARDLMNELMATLDDLADERVRRFGRAVVAIVMTQQLGEGPSVVELAPSGLDEDRGALLAEQRAALGLALLQCEQITEGLSVLEGVLDPHGPAGPQANVGAMAAFGYLAAHRPDDALATLTRYCPPGVGTYADRGWAGIARGFVAVQQGDAAGAEAAFADSTSAVDATGDVLAQATVRLARGVGLGALGLPGAAGAQAEARRRMDALGVGLAGWDRLFRLAVGPRQGVAHLPTGR